MINHLGYTRVRQNDRKKENGMKRYILFLVMGVLIFSILACGSEEAGSTVEPTMSSTTSSTTTSTLTIMNNTQTITICYLYISPTTASDWGEDKLQGTQIAPGENYSIVVEAGIYDLKVSDCEGVNEITREAQDLSNPLNWGLAEETSNPALEIINNTQTVTICYLYISPAGSAAWGEDKLLGTKIEPGKSFSIDVESGIYDLKVEDCNHGSSTIQNALEINNLVRWTLTESSSVDPSGKVTLRVQNDTANITICYLYIAGSDSSIPWGDDILRGSQIPPGGTFDFTLQPGFYKIKAIDCGQTGEVVNLHQDVTKSVIWSIK